MLRKSRASRRRIVLRALAYAATVVAILLLIAPPLIAVPAANAAAYPIVALVAGLLAIACALAYYFGIPARAGPR